MSLFFPTFHDEEQTEQISPIHIRLKPENTKHLVRETLALKWPCKLTETISNISGHVKTYKRKFLPNVDMNLRKIFVVLELTLKMLRFHFTAIGPNNLQCEITEKESVT